MADEDKDQKTEPATDRKREEAFMRGQFARSPDVQVAATLVAALVVMLFSAPAIARSLRDFAAYSFQNLGRTSLSNELMLSRLNESIGNGLSLMAPLLIACFVGFVARRQDELRLFERGQGVAQFSKGKQRQGGRHTPELAAGLQMRAQQVNDTVCAAVGNQFHGMGAASVRRNTKNAV